MKNNKENIEKGSLTNWKLQISETIKLSEHNPKKQPCVLTNHGINTDVIKFD